jgi:hypothetical protein
MLCVCVACADVCLCVQSLWSLWVFLRSEAPPGTVFPPRRALGSSLRGAFTKRRSSGSDDADANDDDDSAPPSSQHPQAHPQAQHRDEDAERDSYEDQLSPSGRMVSSVSSPRLQALLGVAVGTTAAGGSHHASSAGGAASGSGGALLEMSGMGSARGSGGGGDGAAEGAPVGVPAGTGRAAAHLRTRSRDVFSLSASDMV